MTAITFEDEISVQELPDLPGWVENYAFDAFDPKANIGYFIHMSRVAGAPHLWWEKLYIYLPDGTVGAQHNFGARPAPNGASGAALDVVVIEPGRHLQLNYLGPVVRWSEEELAEGHLVQRRPELISFKFDFKSGNEVWDFGKKPTDFGGHSSHIEQAGLVTGTLNFRDKSYTMDGRGYRDHSRGVRKLNEMADSAWLHGSFPSGRAFAVYAVREVHEGAVRPRSEKAVIWDNGKLYEATAHGQPYLNTTNPHNGYGGKYGIVLESEIGTMEIEADIVRTASYTYNGANDYLVGLRAGDFDVFEEPTIFRWNGEVGVGNTERSIRRLPY